MRKFLSGVIVLVALIGCTKTVFLPAESTPLPSPSPTPAPVKCISVPREKGDCHRSSEDVYLSAYEQVVEKARGGGLLLGDEIRNGSAYLNFLVTSLQEAGFCAGIYENEEIAIWHLSDQTFSENWDAILEPGDGGIYVRKGPGAHSWTCNPATTEEGS